MILGMMYYFIVNELKPPEMRKYLLTLYDIMLIVGTSCQQNVNVEKEKEAIMAVLQEAADAIKARDKERMFAVHMKDIYETRLELGI
jgi:hypothetical protein